MTSSVYPNDLGGNELLENLVGHKEDIDAISNDQPAVIVKTHGPPPAEISQTIYVIRNGIDSTLSFYDFLEFKISITDIILGNCWLHNTWAGHATSWNPGRRPNTLLLRYESVVADPLAALASMSSFLQVPIIGRNIPSKEKMISIGSKWIGKRRAPDNLISGEAKDLFDRVNGGVMREYGY